MRSAGTDLGLVVTALCAVACGGGAAAPALSSACWVGTRGVSTCSSAAYPDRAGAWRDVGSGEMAFVFDGCTVTFRYVGGRSPDDPWRYLRGAGLEGVRYTDYGDPPPYYRATARWEGDTLIASSVIAPNMPIARWAAGRFVMRHGPRHAFRRVTRAADLDEQLRAMLCVERRVPTERELFRARGQTAREHVPNGRR